ncbi:MAG: hypothetical protein IKW20_07695 [Bacteroidales bacterium]|nr:hypothetical protein [Bacteroidales bacterium]
MNNERNYEIRVTCNHCKREFVLMVRVEDYFLFDMPNRPHIQDIFPYLTPAERELLISHTCQECWDKMFSFLDDEEA